MYNPYLPGSWDGGSASSPGPDPVTAHANSPTANQGKQGLAGLLKGLKLDEIDTGDVLILLILLFLFLDDKEDNLELLITLGLMLLL